MPKRPQAGSAAAGSDADAKKSKPRVHVSSHKIMIPPNTEPEYVPGRTVLFSAKLKCLFALTVASSGLQLEVVLRKGQRLLDRGPYTGA